LLLLQENNNKHAEIK